MNKAKEILEKSEYTCVLCKGDKEYHSLLRGVEPLLKFLESGECFEGFSSADKVVGAGAAHLYVLLRVGSLWAKVMSDSAEEILIRNGIEVSCEKRVPYIINRSGNGVCPIEKAVKDITDSKEALSVIKQTLMGLKEK